MNTDHHRQKELWLNIQGVEGRSCFVPPEIPALLIEPKPLTQPPAEKFHAENPHVYRSLVVMAQNFRAAYPARRIGIATLWENLRYTLMMTIVNETDFKLNNSHRAFYSRLIMAENPGLEGLFQLREQKGVVDV